MGPIKAPYPGLMNPTHRSLDETSFVRVNYKSASNPIDPVTAEFGPGAPRTRVLVPQQPGSWCPNNQGPGAPTTRGLVPQQPGSWCPNNQGPGAPTTRGLVAQQPGSWMIPPSSKNFLVNNLAAGTQYDLCVLAIYDDVITSLTATRVVGCVQFTTESEYMRCHFMQSQVLGGTMIIIIGGIIVASVLIFIIILMIRYKVCNPGEGGKGVSMSMTNVHSQTNGQQSQTCTVTPSASKHGAIGSDELSGSSKKRGGAAGGGGKDAQSSDSSLRDCAAATSVLSQSWAARSLTAEDREDRGQPGGTSPGAASLNKPKRKPAPSKPGSACSAPPAAVENPPSSSHRPPSSSTSSTAASSMLLPSATPLENHNTNRNNSTSLNQTPPPLTPSPFSSPHATPSPVPSTRFRETPVLRRAPRPSTKYQTLPVEEEGQSKARRRYSLSEGGGSKTPPALQGGRAGTAPKIGRIMRSKRSQSMSGMLLPKDGDADSDKARCDSDWILESTV
ncbi:hypothetical protein fugu_016756 [Takifugu bimaculatus]|uniref:Uncharacterized protein n=1 Tax=Takifugu bimaculatus TaxID=433685 RepID=A0A4Z2BTW8_9TELE|nr:hypothetical protein fugu_016756 [Takifugu bimaculatus]